MHVKVPDVKKCCFCIPLRRGILLFGIVNIIISIVAVSFLVITTELHRSTALNDNTMEVTTSTVLFSIFGMSMILNILLLVAGYQKDISMLRLYNYYGVVTIFAALIPTFMLLSRKMVFKVLAAFIAIAMQIYVIILVRSEIVKLEKAQIKIDDEVPPPCPEEAFVDADTETLL
ncbi:uncharacterized protein LOC101742355 [Bombyx mori]|uniref:Uncharacterized protein n=1 Tax=Bombyx mori TaxID=7091 RepID=A0A8R2G9P9_BOMMO|nr:uncharacterized protein LOC101742355 isoform X1 [Bombyx mori]